jgi:alkylglycerol monooxygenase
MDERLIAIATPIFVVAIVVEWLLNQWHLRRSGQASHTGGRGGYRLDDTVTNLGTGIGQQALDPLLRVAGMVAFAAVQQRWGLWQWDPDSVPQWLLAVLLVDLGFYWFHRASHRMRLLWAVHHVHHSSDEYNLAVALRQPWLEKLVDIPVYLPLALLGMPVEMYAGAFTLDLIYQFFVHTRWVPKLGPLEWWLNTPSHHRVHHAVNPVYIDKNYGGVLIVWDRLFGTFAVERETPIYGTVTPLQTWNVATVNGAPWRDLWRSSRSAVRWQDKLGVWLAAPEWRPASEGGPVILPAADPAIRGWRELEVPAARQFAVAALIGLTVWLSGFLAVQKRLDVLQLFGFAVASVALMTAWGGGLEGRPWARPLAVLSVLGLGIGWPLWVGWQGAALGASMAGAAVLAVLALRIRPLPPAQPGQRPYGTSPA